jgi:replicative DNA helicase
MSAPLTSIEAEQGLLGAVLVNSDALARVESIVTADDFAEPVHRDMFARFIEARDRGQSINIKLVSSTLGNFGSQDLFGMTVSQYVARLAAEATTVINAPDYASTVRELADRRRILSTAETIQSLVAADAPTVQTATDAIELLDGIVSSRTDTSARSVMLGDAAVSSIERMQQAMANPGQLTGLATGLHSLDDRTGGLQRGEFIILAGRPGMGKSALAVAIARLMAGAGFNVLLNSLEMTKEAVADRALADIAWKSGDPIAYSSISRGRVTLAQAERLADAARTFRGLPLRIDPQGGLSVSQIAARARKCKRTLERKGKTLDALIIDHMHITRASDRYAGNAVRETTEISGALKALAKDLNIPVIALAQLSRKVEERDNKRPTLSDLRESGAIEQDADLIAFVFREDYYLANMTCDDPDAEKKRIARRREVENVVEVNIAKQRNGPVGVVPLYCDIACNVFRDLENRR